MSNLLVIVEVNFMRRLLDVEPELSPNVMCGIHPSSPSGTDLVGDCRVTGPSTEG